MQDRLRRLRLLSFPLVLLIPVIAVLTVNHDSSPSFAVPTAFHVIPTSTTSTSTTVAPTTTVVIHATAVPVPRPKPKVIPKPKVQHAPAPSSGGLGGGWEALRQCESGGNYANKSNGTYRGAYQFSRQSWAATGGTGDPADASPAEQDARAQALYARSGRGQWPVCGRHLG